MPLFGKKKYALVSIKKTNVPAGLWSKCVECATLSYTKELEDKFKVCPKCGYHFGCTAAERIKYLLDKDTFEEHDQKLTSADPLKFKGPKTYKQKLEADQKLTGLRDAVLTGTGKIEGRKVGFVVTDSRFIMGSMGSVVGEKISRLIEYSTQNKLPVVIVSGSGGGARMYEGAISLMQMAKTCAALAKHNEAKLLHISVLTDPTMGGIMASFAGVGDIIMAEPRALVGFAGPRVVEQTIRQKLPEGFQKSEFLLAHGLIDMIVDRPSMKKTIAQIVDFSQN